MSNAGAGKGDKRRPQDLKKFGQHFDEIDWSRPKPDVTLEVYFPDGEGELKWYGEYLELLTKTRTNVGMTTI